jgi:hypothetical protein
MKRKPVRGKLWLILAFVVGVGAGYLIFHFTQPPCINVLYLSSWAETIT